MRNRKGNGEDKGEDEYCMLKMRRLIENNHTRIYLLGLLSSALSLLHYISLYLINKDSYTVYISL